MLADGARRIEPLAARFATGDEPFCPGRRVEYRRLRNWERAVRVGAGQGRFRKAFRPRPTRCERRRGPWRRWGIRNPAPCCRTPKNRPVGQPRLRQQAAITKTFDVTQAVVAPGTYEITFQYTTGWNGLAIQQVALTAPARHGRGLADRDGRGSSIPAARARAARATSIRSPRGVLARDALLRSWPRCAARVPRTRSRATPGAAAGLHAADSRSRLAITDHERSADDPCKAAKPTAAKKKG